MEQWHDFFLAEVGASAALTGLVFVGVPINIKDILESSHLVNRALEAILEFFLVLLVASLTLMPHLPSALLGILAALLAGIAWGIVGYLDWINWALIQPSFRRQALVYRALSLSIAAFFVVGGVALVGNRGWGLEALAFGMLLSFCIAVYNAWVLVIEILR